jgi:hypothetical protein
VVVGDTEIEFIAVDNPLYVARTFALSCEQVFPDGPVYHTALYGAVPPDHDELIRIDWPVSIEGLAGYIEGMPKAADAKLTIDKVISATAVYNTKRICLPATTILRA